jgi:hypothetical protein
MTLPCQHTAISFAAAGASGGFVLCRRVLSSRNCNQLGESEMGKTKLPFALK